ncbi:MAG TPA: NAD-dependent epimerase/dehydratase family protein [Anaerolineales bacterium]|nr:NAD-dependent epimerase/dehydratase family protein [Anaerolineales bacterium]
MNPSTSQSEFHVVFGAGPLGQSVARELVQRGKLVRMVNRSGKAPLGLPANVSVIAADVYNRDAARAAARGAAVVYQCTNAPYDKWPEMFPPLQANITEAAISANATLVVADNLYAYGDVNGPLHEGLPYAAHTRKGRTRAQMAEAVLTAHNTGKVRVAIARGSDFYGPGVLESAAGDRMFGRALQGKAAEVLDNIDAPHTYTFIDDFGKALVVLGEREAALGQIWHASNAETVTTRQFVAMVYEELGQPPKVAVMGRAMLWIGGLFIPAAREIVEMMYEFEKPFVVDSNKFERAFGIKGTPLREAVRQTVAWYQQWAGADALKS